MWRALKKRLRIFLSLIPGVNKLLWRIDSCRFRSRLGVGEPEDIFSLYYKTNAWGNPESVSGLGSTIKNTENIRKEIPALLRRLNVHRVLDASCGDYNWFRLIELPKDVYYIGGDIVKPLINKNEEKYGNANTVFLVIDIIKDKLPDADLWLCRDTLNHFSNKDIFLTLNNFLRSNIPYLLVSSNPACDRNVDIPTGSCRQINFELPPFKFCQPMLEIVERREGSPVGRLCLWERQALSRCLADNKEREEIIR